MNKQQMVKEFMVLMGQTVRSFPQFPENINEAYMRRDLIDEENAELSNAIWDEDNHVNDALTNLVEVVDALADLLYVVYGAANTFGISIDEVFEAVHNANMNKRQSDGTIKYREDGKVLKPDNWKPADIKTIVENQIARSTT